MSMAERRQVPGLMAHRADIIPSGVAILEAAMREFGMDSIRLSAHGNMDGYLKKKFQKRIDRSRKNVYNDSRRQNDGASHRGMEQSGSSSGS